VNGGWFYLAHGVMTHWRQADEHGWLAIASVCEIEPLTAGAWYGAGSPAEVEWAAGLPKCRICKSKAGVS